MKMGYEWYPHGVKYSHYQLRYLLPSFIQCLRKDWLKSKRKHRDWGKGKTLGINYINFPYSRTTTTGYFS